MKTTTLTLGLDDLDQKNKSYIKDKLGAFEKQREEETITKEVITFGQICGIASILTASNFPEGSFIVAIVGLVKCNKYEYVAIATNLIGLLLGLILSLFK